MLKERLKNLKVRKKMLVYGVIMIVLVVFLGAISMLASFFMNMQKNDITSVWMPALVHARELDTLTSNYRLQQYGYIAATTDAKRQEFDDAMTAIEQDIQETSNQMQTYFTEQEEFDMMDVISEKWAEYLEHGEDIIALSNSGRAEEAEEQMVGEIKNVYDEFGAVFDQLVEFEQQNTDKSSRNFDILYKFVIIVIIAVVIIAIVLVLLISKVMTALIVEPLHRVEKAVTKLYKEGDLNFDLSYESKDEFGQLVDLINNFVNALVSIIKDEGHLMSEMAQGNFNINSNATDLYIGDFEQILLSMRGIKHKLGSALSGIARSAEQVNVASAQMAEEAQNLADGATQQASGVQEILATIEDVENESEMNAQQAVNVSKRAIEVKGKAEDSNQRMSDMVDEMNRITDTSREISTIIDAIEDIASQTNLLSLNASIEAARAGEAGRGFAVVADEIGKLALQCSKSANNTRQLIETAIQQTEKGNSIASKTAEALFAVSEGIDEIAEMVEQVKSNCEHQSAALKEVDRGMEEISSIVETNSASAEESSATSEELAAHADTLNALLADFQFSAEA